MPAGQTRDIGPVHRLPPSIRHGAGCASATEELDDMGQDLTVCDSVGGTGKPSGYAVSSGPDDTAAILADCHAKQPIDMQRILVTGNAGAGKTTAAQRLATLLELPYTGLDSIVWKAGWIRTPAPERCEQERQLAERTAWVADGVSDVLLQAADIVLFLDVPRHRCFYQAGLRNLPYLFRSRPGLPERCPEIRIAPTLAKIIWHFPHTMKPRILAHSTRPDQCFIHARTRREMDAAITAIDSLVQHHRGATSSSAGTGR